MRPLRFGVPRDPDAAEGQTDDPREELVNRLLEHEKFKSAAQMLQQKQQLEDAVVSNPTLKEFVNDEGAEAELAADVIDLVRTFRQILERAKIKTRQQRIRQNAGDKDRSDRGDGDTQGQISAFHTSPATAAGVVKHGRIWRSLFRHLHALSGNQEKF